MAVCVGAGGVAGVLLGQSDGGSDTDAGRVAALALDAKGLSEDALGLSRAIEEAIAREELEAESEAFRTELARLQARAERIRAHADSDAGVDSPRLASETVERGLGQISRTVVVFERDVVDRLEPVLDAPSPDEETSSPSVDEALAGVTRVLEEQGEALTALTEDLEAAEKKTDTPIVDRTGITEGQGISGSFDVAMIGPDRSLEVGYEVGELEPEVEEFGAAPGEVAITSSASGELTVTNTGSKREGIDLPIFNLVLYWKEADIPPAALGGLRRAGQPTEDVEEGELSEEGVEAAADGSDPCQYEIEGDLHCALARISVDPDADQAGGPTGELILGPDEGVGLDVLEPDGSLAVAEQQARTIVDFIESHAPDLVEVLAMGFEAEAFQAACLPPTYPEEDTTEGIIVEPYPMKSLGLLTGNGEVVFGVEKTERSAGVNEGEPEAPECYTLASD